MAGIVSIPTYGPDYTLLAMTTFGLEKPEGSTILLRPTGLTIDVARNNVVDQMLMHDEFEWIMFLDSDQTVPPETIPRLLSHNLPIVGGLYFFKDPMAKPLCYDRQPDFNARAFYRPQVEKVYKFLLERTEELNSSTEITRVLSGNDGLWPCDAIGTGCLLVRREVFEKVPYPWFSFCEGGTEDLYFCRKAKKYGYEVYVDANLLCGHVVTTTLGVQQFMGRDWTKVPGYDGRRIGEEANINNAIWLRNEWVKCSMENTIPKTIRDQVSRFLDISEGEIIKRMRTHSNAKLTEGFLEKGYETDEYLIDLMMWNYNQTLFAIWSPYNDKLYGKCLDFGGGLGTLSCILKAAGNDVDYYDPSDLMRRFTGFRFDDKAVDIRVLDHLPSDTKYDAIFAMDVLEHIPNHFPDFELEEALKLLSFMLKPGGKLYMNNTWDNRPDYPMHNPKPIEFDRVMEDLDLKLISDTEAVKVEVTICDDKKEEEALAYQGA